MNEETIRTELQRILASEPFQHSERMGRFLRFTVEQAVAGKSDRLKEYLLGVEVFDKDCSFDPRIDPIVRVEARRLRDKLRKYYETDGRDDPVCIDFPKGGYAPVFRERAAGSERPGEQHYPAIAVLPFINRSADPENEYFSDGLTDELIHALTKVEGLRVVAQSSAFEFKGRLQQLREIGERLHVGTVLQGSVRRSGNHLRITAQLINVSDGSYLWSETYDREMKEVFAIQDEISRAIVRTLRVRLIGDRRGPLVKAASTSIEAYQLYLRGRHQSDGRTEQGLRRAIEFYEAAIAEDPNYATAYAGLAESYSLLGHYGFLPPREVMPKGKAAAEKALEMDPELAEAETALAYVLHVYHWSWEEAGRHYGRALELNPGSSDARHWYAYDYLGSLGRLDEALVEIRQALQLDPLSGIINVGIGGIFLMRREYDRAIEQFKKTLELDPSFFKAYTGLGRAYQLKGMYEDAVNCFEKGKQLSGAVFPNGGLGQTYALWGKKAKARHLLGDLEAAAKRTYVQATTRAMIYMGLGELDEAFRLLDKAHEDREGALIFVKSYPAYDGLRADSRYESLLKKIGLADSNVRRV